MKITHFILFLIVLSISSCTQTTQPESFFFEKNKRFIVIYGEECGVEPEIRDGRRILNIPPDGILIIKPNFEDGPIDYKFFRKDISDNYKEININYYNPNDGQPVPGVRILGKGPISTKNTQFSDSTMGISFYLLDDNEEEIYNMEELNEFNIKIANKLNSCKVRKSGAVNK